MSNLNLRAHPTLDDIQTYVADMLTERGFADQNILQRFLLLTEEIGELGKCIRKSHADMSLDINKKYELEAAHEIADILIVLTSVANQLGVNMEQALREKEEKNKLRVWQ